MLTLLSALGSLLSFRFRNRLAQELELVALRHQVTVLRWRCKRAALYSIAEFRRPQSSSTGFLAGWTFEQGQVKFTNGLEVIAKANDLQTETAAA